MTWNTCQPVTLWINCHQPPLYPLMYLFLRLTPLQVIYLRHPLPPHPLINIHCQLHLPRHVPLDCHRNHPCICYNVTPLPQLCHSLLMLYQNRISLQSVYDVLLKSESPHNGNFKVIMLSTSCQSLLRKDLGGDREYRHGPKEYGTLAYL